jgi:hypothetical protein
MAAINSSATKKKRSTFSLPVDDLLKGEDSTVVLGGEQLPRTSMTLRKCMAEQRDTGGSGKAAASSTVTSAA